MERPVKTVSEHRQVLVDFLGGNLTVLLGGGYVRVTQYPAHTFNGDTLAQGQRCESMTGKVEYTRQSKQQRTGID